MRESGVADLLAFIAGFDQRTVGSTDIDAWTRALARLDDLEECMEAVVDHYQNFPDTQIRPGHVIRYVRPPESDAARHPSARTVQEAEKAALARHHDEMAGAVASLPEPDEQARLGKQMVLRAMRQAHEANVARRDMVLKHPDLAARLCQDPLQMARPGQWTGFICQDEPERSVLLDIAAEAARRG